MTKAEVIAEIVEKTKKEKEDVQEVLESFFKIVKNSMEQDNSIYIRGFGSFVNKKRAEKKARNISKETTMIIKAHYIPSFKPSKIFIEKIKNSDVLKEKIAEEERKKEESQTENNSKSSE